MLGSEQALNVSLGPTVALQNKTKIIQPLFGKFNLSCATLALLPLPDFLSRSVLEDATVHFSLFCLSCPASYSP